MKLNRDNTYLFYDIDRHGTIFNQAPQMLVNEFTLLCRFYPDFDHLENKFKELKEKHPDRNPYVKQCIVAKNGKHMGLFFTSYYDDHGNLLHCIEYEWWQNPLWEQNQSMDDDECKNVQIYLNPNDYEYFDVVVTKYDSKFKIVVKGNKEFDRIEQKKEHLYDCVIDYSKSLMWLGAANRLLDDTENYDESFACIYTGEINLLHVQETRMTKPQIDLFFEDFNKFLELKLDARKNTIYVSTDFGQVTPYKVRDYSGNGLHPLLFNKEWIG